MFGVVEGTSEGGDVRCDGVGGGVSETDAAISGGLGSKEASVRGEGVG